MTNEMGETCRTHGNATNTCTILVEKYVISRETLA